MNGAVSWADGMSAIGFAVMVLGALWGIWRTVDSKIQSAEDKAASVGSSLDAHKLHVAETYLTKAGLREQMEPLFDAVKGVSGQVQTMNERLDRVIEAQPKRDLSAR